MPLSQHSGVFVSQARPGQAAAAAAAGDCCSQSAHSILHTMTASPVAAAAWLPHVLAFGDATMLGRCALVCSEWRDAITPEAVASVVWHGGVHPLQQAGFLDVALGVDRFLHSHPSLASALPLPGVGEVGITLSAAQALSNSRNRNVTAAAAAAEAAGPGLAPSVEDTATRQARVEVAEAAATLARVRSLLSVHKWNKASTNPHLSALHGSRFQRAKMKPALECLERCCVRAQPKSLADAVSERQDHVAVAVKAVETSLLACSVDKVVVMAELLDVCPDLRSAVASFVCLNRRLCLPKPHRQAEMALSWWQSALLEPASDATVLDKLPPQLLLHVTEQLMKQHMPRLEKYVLFLCFFLFFSERTAVAIGAGY